MTYYRRVPEFDYLAPKSIGEVFSLLGRYKGDATLFAGGTIALHQMKERIGARPYVIGLKGVSGLDALAVGKDGVLTVGAMVLLQRIADSAEVQGGWPLLATVCRLLGTPQIRNMGTIGGNVAIRFSTAETLPALIALRAQVRIAAAGGETVVPVENLYREMKSDNLLTEFLLPALPKGVRMGYRKFAVREHFDYATVGAAVVLDMDDGKTCKDITIGLGGVTLPTMRAKGAEEIMKGRTVTDDIIAKAAEAAAEGGHMGSDVMFSAGYKSKVLKTMVERAIKEAVSD